VLFLRFFTHFSAFSTKTVEGFTNPAQKDMNFRPLPAERKRQSDGSLLVTGYPKNSQWLQPMHEYCGENLHNWQKPVCRL